MTEIIFEVLELEHYQRIVSSDACIKLLPVLCPVKSEEGEL